MGTNNKAAEQAAAASAAQQAQINQTIGQINAAYNSPSRQAQYAQYGKQVKDYLTGQAALEQADIGSKNALIAQAEQGAYLGSIPQAVAQASQANLGAAQNYSNASTLGNIFAGTAGIYQNEQQAYANRRAQQSPIGSLYG